MFATFNGGGNVVLRICAWCGEKPNAEEAAAGVIISHGLCRRHSRLLRRQIRGSKPLVAYKTLMFRASK